jgi:hypothetical protein
MRSSPDNTEPRAQFVAAGDIEDSTVASYLDINPDVIDVHRSAFVGGVGRHGRRGRRDV